MIEVAAQDKQKRVLKAVKQGLLQVHGTAPNTKQQGIFQIMGENCNGLSNRIRGNEKITKALRTSRRILMSIASCTASIASILGTKITKTT